MIQSFFRGVFCGQVDVSNPSEAVMPSTNKLRSVPLKAMHDYFREKCTLFGNRLAYIEYSSGRSLTFVEVLRLVEKFAGALQSFGVKPHDRVALHGNNSIDVFIAYLAVQFVNATVVLCKTTLTIREMCYQCTTSDVKFIISDNDAFEIAVAAAEQMPAIEMIILTNKDVVPEGYDNVKTMSSILSNDDFEFEPPSDVQPRDHGVIIAFTSGTTGLPKGVLHTHFSLQAQFECSGDDGARMVRSTDIMLQWCPISHISGSLLMPIALANGCTSVVANANVDVNNFVDICERYKITSVMAFPVILKKLIELLRQNPGTCRSMKHVTVGGSVVAVTWSEAIVQLLELQSYRILYGMSETLLVSLTDDNAITFTSVGKPFPNTEIAILDMKTRRPLPPFEKGELALRGDFNMKEYDNRPEATDEIFTEDRWLLTGLFDSMLKSELKSDAVRMQRISAPSTSDFGYVDDEGQFYVLERLKQMIKCMDNQLTPAELESFLLEREAVKEIVIIGLPDINVGEAPTAFVVLNDGHDPTEELREELKNAIKEEFAPFKHLHGGLHFTNLLPKTDSGKFARAELKALLKEGKLDFV